jgi:polar amino acid transport system substrate-binding protein/glutamate/aspartate transport system substrate-binding protein
MLARSLLALGATFWSLTAQAQVLDRVRASGTMTLGYRTDAMPFAHRTPIGEAAGYSVELCRLVAADVKAALGLPELAVRWVEVTAEDRFEKVARGQVDIECGATTVTLARRRQVDFSLLTFASGATLLYRADGPGSFEQLAGRKVGVRAGTTTETMLAELVGQGGLAVTLVPVASHEAGVADLAADRTQAYFGDGAILLFHWLASPARASLRLSDRTFSYEPYALVLPKGDDAFRLQVDTTLARLYRSGAIARLFDSVFPGAQPSAKVRALFELNALPE